MTHGGKHTGKKKKHKVLQYNFSMWIDEETLSE